jgi:hypothetical protein
MTAGALRSQILPIHKKARNQIGTGQAWNPMQENEQKDYSLSFVLAPSVRYNVTSVIKGQYHDNSAKPGNGWPELVYEISHL